MKNTNSGLPYSSSRCVRLFKLGPPQSFRKEYGIYRIPFVPFVYRHHLPELYVSIVTALEYKKIHLYDSYSPSLIITSTTGIVTPTPGMHVVIRLGSRSLILFFGLLSTSAQHDNCPPCRSGSDVTLTRAMAGQPLGLRLSQELEILEFHPTDAGLPRAIEASGRTALGDQLVAVNGESIDLANNMSFQQAIALLQQATFPKTLSFRRGPRELDFCPDEEFEEDELEEKEPELGQDGHGLIIVRHHALTWL